MEETKEIKMSKKDKVKNFIKDNKETIVMGLGMAACYIWGYKYGRSDRKTINANAITEFANLYNSQIDEECDLAVINFAKKVMPKEKTLYVVERYHDAHGHTLGELGEFIRNNYKLIEDKKED